MLSLIYFNGACSILHTKIWMKYNHKGQKKLERSQQRVYNCCITGVSHAKKNLPVKAERKRPWANTTIIWTPNKPKQENGTKWSPLIENGCKHIGVEAESAAGPTSLRGNNVPYHKHWLPLFVSLSWKHETKPMRQFCKNKLPATINMRMAEGHIKQQTYQLSSCISEVRAPPARCRLKRRHTRTHSRPGMLRYNFQWIYTAAKSRTREFTYRNYSLLQREMCDGEHTGGNSTR